MAVHVPESFRHMPRWQQDGVGWLDELPGLVLHHCARLGLDLEPGTVWHGSNALVVLVRRGGVPLALRLAPPADPVAEQAAALRFWAGRGTVQLVEADPDGGVLLLERLDPSASLEDLPLAEAVPLLAGMMTRLAIPAPAEAPGTGDLVVARCATLEQEWQAVGRPFRRALLETALAVGDRLAGSRSGAAVNGDLHYAQVLSGRRERWLAVDPVLLRGDIEYDLARMLWTRLDEMATAHQIRHWLDVVVSTAQLDRDHAWAWAVFRSVDYWLWGLQNGLTEDPQRCRRLLDALLD